MSVQIISSFRVADDSQIVYISCVSPILVAAFLEWFLWLAAFFYCLSKAFKKADRWSQRALAFLLTLVFVTIR
jgi:chitin synthase